MKFTAAVWFHVKDCIGVMRAIQRYKFIVSRSVHYVRMRPSILLLTINTNNEITALGRKLIEFYSLQAKVEK
jgi:hypothetical protein